MTTILKFNQISNLSFGLLIALRIQRSKEAIYKAPKKTCCVTHNIIEGSKAKRGGSSVYQPEDVVCV